MKPALLALLAVLAWGVAPFWLQDGMFMDGQIYAAVAQNLADGLGRFWAPVYQPSSPVPYSEQLPMFTGMESLLFRTMGGTTWTERVFMALAWVATAFGLVVLQRNVWPEAPRETALWTLVVWSSAPLVGWGMGNHVQEMWMAPFTVWAAVAMMHPRWAWLGGILTVGAALFKGPQGLFPLAWLPILALGSVLPRAIVLRRFASVGAVVLAAAAMLWFWDDAREAILRNAGNRLVRTFTQDRAVTTSARWWLLGPLLGQWAVLFAASLAAAWLRFGTLRPAVDRRVLAVLALSLCASIPLMVTHEQRDFYLITSLPFAALGLANAVRGGTSVRKPWAMGVLGILALAGLATLPLRRVERDTALRASLAAHREDFAPRAAFNVSPELRLNHELAAYAMRYYRWEVDLANTRRHEGHIVPDSVDVGGVLLQLKE